MSSFLHFCDLFFLDCNLHYKDETAQADILVVEYRRPTRSDHAGMQCGASAGVVHRYCSNERRQRQQQFCGTSEAVSRAANEKQQARKHERDIRIQGIQQQLARLQHICSSASESGNLDTRTNTGVRVVAGDGASDASRRQRHNGKVAARCSRRNLYQCPR